MPVPGTPNEDASNAVDRGRSVEVGAGERAQAAGIVDFSDGEGDRVEQIVPV